MRIDRVREILEAARQKRILIAGDLMLDEYLWGEVTRISPEAPVPVVRVTGESWYPGGAANVARNVCEFAKWTGVLGTVGNDEGGRRLAGALRDYGIDISGLIALDGKPTIVKTRIIAKHQQVVRVDREQLEPSSPDLSQQVSEALGCMVPDLDAIIVSDYAKGFLSQPIADSLLDVARLHERTVTVDPSPLNPVDWKGATAIKPNRSEALRAAGLHELTGGIDGAALLKVGERLLERWQSKLLLLTLGEEGMMLFERGAAVYHTPARAREVFDVSGAGDTAIAVFTVALCAGATAPEAAELANAAAGIVVGKLGTATVSREELLAEFGKGQQ